MLGVLGQEGEDSRTSVTFYKATFQEVILFESDTWVMNPQIGRTLGGFHHRVAHQLVGVQKRNNTEGGWEYPLLV